MRRMPGDTHPGKGLLNEEGLQDHVSAYRHRPAHRGWLIDDGVGLSRNHGQALQDMDRAVIIGSPFFRQGRWCGHSLHSLTTACSRYATGKVLAAQTDAYIRAIDFSRRNPDGSVAPHSRLTTSEVCRTA